MEFTELHKDIDCDCIEGASQNCVDYFARRVGNDDKGIKDRYFKVSEKNKTAQFVNCEDCCGARSLSIDIWHNDIDDFLDKKKISVQLNPGFRNSLLIFKIKQYGGLVKHTPNTGNPFHHDLYTHDSFSVETCLEYIKTIKLTNHAI